MPKPPTGVTSPTAFAQPFPWLIQNKEVKFAPLSLGDLAALTQYMRSTAVRIVQSAIDDTTPPDVRRTMIDSALETAQGIDVVQGGERVENLLRNIDVLIHIVWLSVRKHERVKQEAVGEWFSMQNIADLQQLVMAILRTSGFKVTDDAEPAATEGGTPAPASTFPVGGPVSAAGQ